MKPLLWPFQESPLCLGPPSWLPRKFSIDYACLRPSALWPMRPWPQWWTLSCPTAQPWRPSSLCQIRVMMGGWISRSWFGKWALKMKMLKLNKCLILEDGMKYEKVVWVVRMGSWTEISSPETRVCSNTRIPGLAYKFPVWVKVSSPDSYLRVHSGRG